MLEWKLGRRAFSRGEFKGGEWSSSLQGRMDRETLKARIQYLNSTAGKKVPANIWYSLPPLVIFIIWISVIFGVVMKGKSCFDNNSQPSSDFTLPSDSKPSASAAFLPAFPSVVPMSTPAAAARTTTVLVSVTGSASVPLANATPAPATLSPATNTSPNLPPADSPAPSSSSNGGGSTSGGGSSSPPSSSGQKDITACTFACPKPPFGQCTQPVSSDAYWACRQEISKPWNDCVERCYGRTPSKRRSLHRRDSCTSSTPFNGFLVPIIIVFVAFIVAGVVIYFMRQNDLTNARKATRKALEVLNGQDNPRGLFWRYNEMKRTTTTYQGGRRTGQTKEYFPMAELEVMPIPSFSLSGMDDAVFTPPMASMSPRVGTVSQSEFAAPYAYQQAPLTGTSMAPRTQPAAAFAAPARPASSAISMSSVPGPSRLPPTSTRQYLTSSPSANERESHGSSANPFTDDANLADEYDPEAPPPAYDSFSRPSRPAQQSSKRGKF